MVDKNEVLLCFSYNQFKKRFLINQIKNQKIVRFSFQYEIILKLIKNKLSKQRFGRLLSLSFRTATFRLMRLKNLLKILYGYEQKKKTLFKQWSDLYSEVEGKSEQSNVLLTAHTLIFSICQQYNRRLYRQNKQQMIGNQKINHMKQRLNFQASHSEFQAGNDSIEINTSSEYQQGENPLKNVFQKQICKKSINQIKNKLTEVSNHQITPENVLKVRQNCKENCLLAKTLFQKEKLKKISNKIIQSELILSNDLIECSQSQQNTEAVSASQNISLFQPILISQESIFKIKNAKIDQRYSLLQKIGEGGFGIVYKAQCLVTHQLRAIKILQMNKFTSFEKQLIQNQISIISQLDHPNIIKIYQILKYNSVYYIVTEYCEGGPLSDYLKNKRPANIEQFAKQVIYKLLSALKYMHSKQIIHRDIKLDNIVFKTIVIDGKEEMVIKIIDFGLAVKYHQKDPVKSEKIIGTPQYLSPESLSGLHYPSSDVWCCGVILYLMLTEHYPFKGSTKTKLISNIRSKPLTFKSFQWQHLSKNAKQLVNSMLQKNHDQRLSAEKALKHLWFNQYYKKERSELSLTCKRSSEIAQQLLNFQRYNNLITFLDSYTILTKLRDQQREKLIVYFNLIDKDRDGVINCQELMDYFLSQNIQLSQFQLAIVLKKLDFDNSQTIYLNQFIYAIANIQKYYQPSYIEELFQLFDQNKDGYIDQSELKLMLDSCNPQEIDYFINNISKKGLKRFNLDEFKCYIKSAKRRKSKIYL